MHQISMSSANVASLNLDVTKLKKRAEAVEKKLGKSIVELVSPVVESHVMLFGTQFNNGVELAMFTSDVIEFVIAGLMEKGKIMKTLPGSKAEKDEHPGQYL